MCRGALSWRRRQKEAIMKWLKAACVFMLLFGVLANSAAWAHGFHHGHFHHGGHVGVFIGAPLGFPWYYPPYYAYPPVAIAPAAPPVYIEQGDQQGSDSADNWWY